MGLYDENEWLQKRSAEATERILTTEWHKLGPAGQLLRKAIEADAGVSDLDVKRKLRQQREG